MSYCLVLVRVAYKQRWSKTCQ